MGHVLSLGRSRLPAAVASYTMGVGSVTGWPNLSAWEHLRLVALADALHARSGYRSPPDPLRLASADGIRLHPLPPEEPQIERIGLDRAWYIVSQDPGEQGLLVAHALAGSLLRRAGLYHREPDAWALAAHLLAPSWLAERWPPGQPLPGCPHWLPALRRRFDRLGAGEAVGVVQILFAGDPAST